MNKKKQVLIRWLPNMKKVLYALIPVTAGAVYFFGWKALVLVIISNLAGFITEFIFNKKSFNEPVSSSVFVSGTLFALTLPPTVPIWMAVVGIIFGILFGKLVFGGFGRNIFNPAIVGRAFLYISFGVEMTSEWVAPASGVPGGLTTWVSDAVTGATPMKALSEQISQAPTILEQGQSLIDGTTHTIPSYLQMLIGNISGCIGETSAILLLIGGLYLLFTKTANYRIVIGGFIGLLVMQTIFWLTGTPGAYDPLSAVLTGGFLLGILYMATDPISASGTDFGRWFNGIFIGAVTVLIRVFANWPEGMMFAILLANMFTPIMDYAVKELKKRKKAKEATT